MVRWLVLVAVFASCTDEEPEVVCRRRCSVVSFEAYVEWKFYPTVGGNEHLVCPAGAVQVALVTESGVVKQFPCAAHSGTIIRASSDDRVFAQLLDADGNVMSSTPPRSAPSHALQV